MSSPQICRGSNGFPQVILLVAITMLAGCAGPLTKSVLVSNDVQEDAETQLLVRNILRARDHLPMHFTAISQVRVAPDGFGLGTPGLQATIPFGGPGTGYALTPSLTSPSSVDTTPLTSQEYYQGITKELTISVMAYYLQQGWPPDLILNLFIQSIVYVSDTKTKAPNTNAGPSVVIGRIDNDGGSSQAEFDSMVRQMLRCEIVADTDTEPTFYGGPNREVDLKDLRALANAKTAKLVPIHVDANGNALKDDDWHNLGLDKRSVAFADVTEFPSLRFEQGTSARTEHCPPLTLRNKSEPFGNSVNTRSLTGLRAYQSEAGSADSQNSTKGDSAKSGPKLRFVLRSPEGMLRYLGRLSRVGAVQPCLLNASGQCEATAGRALFQVSSASSENAAITVDYRDGPYYVAKFSDNDRSVQALALVMQLLALQNKGTQAPATTNVRVLR